MPKEPKTETTRRLSRFFHDNLDVIKERNLITDFEVSPYFVNVAKKKSSLEEIKKKKVKRKPSGPQFEGFSKDDQHFSRIKKIGIVQAVTDREDRIKEIQPFLGFSQEEINRSNLLCDRIWELPIYFDRSLRIFRGFSEYEQTESISKISTILSASVSIRNHIYKNIDRRILTHHMTETKRSQPIVCSKYWWIKTEDKTWKENDIMDENSFLKKNKKKIKEEQIKPDIRILDRENVILTEIQKLNEELREIRKIKYAATEEEKVKNSPFMQIKKELIIYQFIPPKSPHHLLEEDLYHDPWALLVATIFLNKTSARSARPYVFWFLEENPDPLTVVGKRVEQLETYFGALGLQKTRAVQVWRMSHDFLYKEWKKVGELYGVGRYAEDAFRLFCLGDFSVEPKDRYLKIYKAWYEMNEKKSRLREMNS